MEVEDVTLLASAVLAFLLGLVGSADAHEWTDMSASVREGHQRYHRVTENFINIDYLETTLAASTTKMQFSFYVDPSTLDFYQCLGSRDSGTCAEAATGKNYNWSEPDIARGKTLKAAPVVRVMSDITYLLDRTEPIAQHTTFTYYRNASAIFRCRSTFTQYTFEYRQGGNVLFFDSNKQNELVTRCEQRFPRK